MRSLSALLSFLFFLPVSAMEVQPYNDKILNHFRSIKTFIKWGNEQDLANYLDAFKRPEPCQQLLRYYNKHGFTLLHIAIIKKPHNINIIKKLLENGADANQGIRADYDTVNKGTYYGGWTAAHLAVHILSNYDVLELLVSHGADFLAEDNGGYSAISIAENRKLKLLKHVQFLLKEKEKKIIADQIKTENNKRYYNYRKPNRYNKYKKHKNVDKLESWRSRAKAPVKDPTIIFLNDNASNRSRG